MVFANLIWPAMYINEGFSAFWVAALSVVIEAYFFGKAFCCNSQKKALILSLIANAATAFLGHGKNYAICCANTYIVARYAC